MHGTTTFVIALCSRRRRRHGNPRARRGRRGDDRRAGELVVFEAASLKEAFATLAARFEKDHAGTHVVTNTAGSQELRAQLEHGAVADVFASADQRHMNALATEGLVVGPALFACNEPVVVVRSRPRRLAEDLRRSAARRADRRRRARGPHRRLHRRRSGRRRRRSWGPTSRRASQAKVVSRELNVRQVLAKVVLGEADAGIVYRSDAHRGQGEGRRGGDPARAQRDGGVPDRRAQGGAPPRPGARLHRPRALAGGCDRAARGRVRPLSRPVSAAPQLRRGVVRSWRSPGRRAIGLLSGLLLLLVALPLAGLLFSAPPRQLLAGLSDPLVVPALRLTLFTTTVSLLVILTCGTPLAWVIARRTSVAVEPAELAAPARIWRAAGDPRRAAGGAAARGGGRGAAARLRAPGPARPGAGGGGDRLAVHARGRGRRPDVRGRALLSAGRHRGLSSPRSRSDPGGAHAGRVAAARPLHGRHPGLVGQPGGRRGDELGPRARRVRRHVDVRRQHERANADAAAGHLHGARIGPAHRAEPVDPAGGGGLRAAGRHPRRGAADERRSRLRCRERPGRCRSRSRSAPRPRRWCSSDRTAPGRPRRS